MAIAIDNSPRKMCKACEEVTSHVSIEIDEHKIVACYMCMLDALEAATRGLLTEVEVED